MWEVDGHPGMAQEKCLWSSLSFLLQWRQRGLAEAGPGFCSMSPTAVVVGCDTTSSMVSIWQRREEVIQGSFEGFPGRCCASQSLVWGLHD